jgi:hypothetical protein
MELAPARSEVVRTLAVASAGIAPTGAQSVKRIAGIPYTPATVRLAALVGGRRLALRSSLSPEAGSRLPPMVTVAQARAAR